MSTFNVSLNCPVTIIIIKVLYVLRSRSVSKVGRQCWSRKAYKTLFEGAPWPTYALHKRGVLKPKDDKWWPDDGGGLEQKMIRIYHPSIQCLCVQSFNLPGVNIFQWWIFFRGEYFPGVNFFRGEYFSEVHVHWPFCFIWVSYSSYSSYLTWFPHLDLVVEVFLPWGLIKGSLASEPTGQLFQMQVPQTFLKETPHGKYVPWW